MSPWKLLCRLRGAWLVALPVILVAATVFATSSIQKSAEQRGFDRVQHSQQLLAAWLDRGNALRVFLQTGSTSALEEFDRLSVPFQAALQVERTDVRDVATAKPILFNEVRNAQRWQSLALLAAANIRRHGVRPLPIAITKPRSDASAAFQAANERYTLAMEGRRTSDIETASEIGIGIVVLAVLILAFAALAVTRASRGSERRLMEEQMLVLERQRLALDDAQRLARVGSWSWDTEHDQATWTTEMYTIFDRDPTRGAATSDELFAHVHPDDREQLAAGYATTFGGGPSFALDYRIVLATGVTRTLHGLGRRDPDHPNIYVGTVQDVTELRQVERQLRRERDYGAVITSSMHEGFILTRDGAILEVNQALCERTGFTREELVGAHTPYPFWAPESAEEISRQRALIGERGHEWPQVSRSGKEPPAVGVKAGEVLATGYYGHWLQPAGPILAAKRRVEHELWTIRQENSPVPRSLLVAAAAALVLAGCGGSSSSRSTATPAPATSTASNTPTPAATPFLSQLTKVSTLASTVPANGDVNPYGLAMVPNGVGRLRAGELLVSNFNAKSNNQGTGTTIVQISTTGKSSLFTHISAKSLPGSCPGGVGLTTALSVIPGGYVIVGSLPTTNGKSATASYGCLIVLNSGGHPISTIAGPNMQGPWDMTAATQGSTTTLFVSMVLNGGPKKGLHTVNNSTVLRIQLSSGTGQPPKVLSQTVIANAIPWRDDPAALAIGPTGVALATNGTLYLADTLDNRISAIPQALTRTAPAPDGGTTISEGQHLKQPIGLALAPNGDILTTNAANGNIVETSPAGQQLLTRTADRKTGAGALFGLVIAPGGSAVYYVDDGDNTLKVLR
jgi:PAS domain-containing protein